ncbi:MAG TPA: lipid II flippase MurJ, partial [Planctomycetota bacterium]|nr:lipid II flippase MurJ [Planctomycetota bacterium]
MSAPRPSQDSSPDSPHASDRDITSRHRRLGRRTVWISAMTLVSRILGFIRETLSAALFGDRSPVFDAFITAWRIPNMLRRFLGEGALATSFQTALTEVDGDQGSAAGAALFRSTARQLVWILFAVTAILVGGVLLVPDHMPFTGWAWLGSDPEPVRLLAARVMPFLILICLAALVGGGLQVRGHFTAPALAPAAMNLVWIGTLVGLGLGFGYSAEHMVDPSRHLAMAKWLAWGVLLSGLAQLVVQIPALYRVGLLGVPAPLVGPPAGAVRGVLWRSLPMALGAAVYQINVMVDGLMAE